MKKQLYYFRIGLVITMLISLCSCEKYLSVQSNDQMKIVTSLTDMQMLLDDTRIMNMSLSSFAEASADDYFIDDITYKTFTDTDQKTYVWDNYDYYYKNDWAYAYNVVYNCNLVLQKINVVDQNNKSNTLFDEVKGTALFFRGNQYLNLLWTYAKAYDPNNSRNELGIVLRTTSDFNVLSKRSTVEESYQAVISDLRQAERLLSDQRNVKTRPNKLAVWGTLARTYLSMGKYDSAFYYSDRLLAVNSALMDFNSDEDIQPDNQYPFKLFNKETISYFELTPSIMTSPGNIMVDTLLYSKYEENDLRKKYYFKISKNGYPSFYGNYSGSYSLFGGISIAEMYLTKAECAARMGNISSAILETNRLLQKRYKLNTYRPFESNKKDDVLNWILMERRKELLMRGLRWMDIKRLNVEFGDISLKRIINGQTYLLKANSDRFALPLPNDVIRQTGIEQNKR
ncbi:RagB/SusD family nutrient uptake outer membrane protein [Sphingobacterium kitahiroshimense]|uniref:RagB/SusD family nutrient uptake outer membrane protein n=1 Tax=Sphingobacterium kitahiroshimense TaxID=470446 RepID=A0ABV0BPK8_9SPHI